MARKVHFLTMEELEVILYASPYPSLPAITTQGSLGWQMLGPAWST
jgi:hypothetical protein